MHAFPSNHEALLASGFHLGNDFFEAFQRSVRNPVFSAMVPPDLARKTAAMEAKTPFEEELFPRPKGLYAGGVLALARWREWVAPFDGIETINPDTSWRRALQSAGWRPRLHLLEALIDYPLRPPETIARLLQPNAGRHRRICRPCPSMYCPTIS